MRSGLSGIHGVVADLITVPEGYETAIETALGAGLQNIVCTDDESAKAAIRALKANKAGRLTFLPVSSVRGRASYDERLRQEPGFRGFGPECLTFDPRYQGIISYLLGRVVIVDDMDHAVRMSKKGGGLRFVTLDGEVINAGGAITGGKYKNKTANILDRKAEIQTLQKDIDGRTRQKDDVARKLESLREGIAGHGAEMEELEEEIGILSWPKSILFIVGGALAIAFGGDLTVDAASRIAIDLGMSQTLVGLTIVSIGTSLPELVTSVVAARKNEVDMAVGNAVGSNIFNILMVLGVASAINPVALIRENIIDIVILIVFSLIVWIYAATKQRISRKEGISMVCMYLIYAGYIIWR